MIAFLDAEPAASVLVGEGHAPVVAVLLVFAEDAESPPATSPSSKFCYPELQLLLNSPGE
jgi:hypothetical protein